VSLFRLSHSSGFRVPVALVFGSPAVVGNTMIETLAASMNFGSKALAAPIVSPDLPDDQPFLSLVVLESIMHQQLVALGIFTALL
jgi:hypothetical protein